MGNYYFGGDGFRQQPEGMPGAPFSTFTWPTVFALITSPSRSTPVVDVLTVPLDLIV